MTLHVPRARISAPVDRLPAAAPPLLSPRGAQKQQGPWGVRRRRPIAWYCKTERWRKLTRRLRKAASGCAACGKQTPALVLDHIHEVLDGGAIWEESNLQVLCYSCHGRKTWAVAQKRKEARKLGPKLKWA